MIYFITGREDSYDKQELLDEGIQISNIDEFKKFVSSSNSFQLDVETSMTPDGPTQHEDRVLYAVQVGNLSGNIQFVFDIPELPESWLNTLTTMLSDENNRFLGHNMIFEYIVLKSNLGIEIENIHDTFLISKILMTGLDTPPGYHSLKGLVHKILGIDMSKEEQTSFNGSILTANQIKYAANDVKVVGPLYNNIYGTLKKRGLLEVYNIERSVLKAYADMQLSPMKFDVNYWKEMIIELEKDVIKIEDELKALVFADTKLVAYLQKHAFSDRHLITPSDAYEMNWGSSTFRKTVLNVLMPSLPDGIVTKPAIKKHFKENAENIPIEEHTIYDAYINSDYDLLTKVLINDHHDFLKSSRIFIPANTFNVNWGSVPDKLAIFKYYYPNLTSTDAKALVRITTNPIINKYKEWTHASKNTSTYGQSFLTNYVKPNGTITPSGLNQILSTGRVSFGILLQMPKKSMFRNGILPPEGSVFVDTDYSSFELILMAARAGEEVILSAAREGRDLHSASAQAMFKEKWDDIAEPGCVQITTGQRCSCESHDKLRTISKTISFGLAYGLSPIGLADRLNITKEEAQDMTDTFFRTFPGLKAMFERDAHEGSSTLCITGMPPINRKRYFAYPQYKSDIGSIERKSKNFPKPALNSFNYNTIMQVLNLMNGEVKSREFEENLQAL